MIGEFDSDSEGGIFQPARHFVVGLTGSGVTRGVVVNDDDRVRAVANCLPQDFGRVCKGLVAGASEDISEMDEAFAMVEKDHPDRLLRQHLHFRADEGKNIFWG